MEKNPHSLVIQAITLPFDVDYFKQNKMTRRLWINFLLTFSVSAGSGMLHALCMALW